MGLDIVEKPGILPAAMNPEANESNQAEISAQMRRNIAKFKRLVEAKFEEDQSRKSKIWGISKVELGRGGFAIYYEKDSKTAEPVFTIKEPFSSIEFEFGPEDEGIRRTIVSADNISEYNSENLNKNIEDIKTDISSRLLDSEEIEDLLTFLGDTKPFIVSGPPKTLVCINNEEDDLLIKHNLPTWNLPHHA